MLKNEIKQEKRNYYDKNIMKRLFIKTPNSKIYKIIKDAKTLDVPYQLTWTCYNPKKEVTEFLDNNIEVTATPCLECESCKERESMGSLVLTDVNKYSITYKVEA